MKKKRIVVCILFLILILFFIIIVTSLKKKETQNHTPKNEPKTTEKNNLPSEIDYLADDNSELNEKTPIMEVENKSDQGSKGFENYRLASNTDKAHYEITNIKKTSDSKKTTITGKIKNNGGSENIVIKAEFMGKTKSSSSIEIKDLKVGKSQNFEIKILNNAATNDYTVYVEYVGE